MVFGIAGIVMTMLALSDPTDVGSTVTVIAMSAVWIAGGYFGALARWSESDEDLSKHSAIAGVLTLSGIAVGLVLDWLLT
ncbi:hypothetical protein NLX83_06500 [Allokutzneria sp. A3M-2-11 16]|uniref:hypothetical protein n=1 Tax=Allokutzneria sp. A3M-2-11 16 TaxID=2962043 RepID=UPI0020B89FAA|nr:hypothetical protein [Allokutzneria sp. A3M-2-11 16]MCP3798904.1 hypothetical protein [Allokutzneria sp. A3M-2-11 16]